MIHSVRRLENYYIFCLLSRMYLAYCIVINLNLLQNIQEKSYSLTILMPSQKNFVKNWMHCFYPSTSNNHVESPIELTSIFSNPSDFTTSTFLLLAIAYLLCFYLPCSYSYLLRLLNDFSLKNSPFHIHSAFMNLLYTVFIHYKHLLPVKIKLISWNDIITIKSYQLFK